MEYAVIMAGGGGTRLWPLSRLSRPKQMLHLGSDRRGHLVEPISDLTQDTRRIADLPRIIALILTGQALEIEGGIELIEQRAVMIDLAGLFRSLDLRDAARGTRRRSRIADE